MANSEWRIEASSASDRSFASLGSALLIVLGGLFLLPPNLRGEDTFDAALAAVRADEARRTEVFAHVAEAVVCIFSDDQRSGGGSGVVIDPEGYGLTNFHVVQPFIEARRGFGGLADGRLYPLRVLGVDPGGDVALFKLEGAERFTFAPLGNSDTLRVGQWVAAMGNPFVLAEDFSPTITLGVISGLHRYQWGQGNVLEYADCIQVSTSINPGNSGGPLFDLEGRVIGINGRASFEERGRVNVGLGYAVSINQIKRFLPGLRAGRLLEHGTLGATVRGTGGGNLIISAIQPFSAAERAGAQLGDELLEVAGRPLRTANDYNNILAILPADWPVTLKLIRDGQSVEVAARLERLPLGVPLVYVPDLEHNHRELLNLLDRSAKRTGTSLRRPFSRVVFRGRVRTGQGGEVRTVVLTVASRVDSAATAEPLPSEEPVDASLADEWQELASPLLARPEVDLRWELLAGDEVEGRIVSVVERRIEADRRIRWKLDFQTDELRQVTIGTQERPAEVAWQPGNLAEFGDLHWPGVWTRRGHAGDGLLLEIDSIEPAYVSEETSAGSPQ